MLKQLTKPIRPFHCLVLPFLMTLSFPIAAHNYRMGSNAFKAGDYVMALQEWTPLAEAGDALAQFMLGVFYFNRFDVGMGFSQHSGVVICAYGTLETAKRIEQVLWVDPTSDAMQALVTTKFSIAPATMAVVYHVF